MLASEVESDVENRMEEASEQAEDIWADINLATLCRHLNLGADEQTHPWDPVVIVPPVKSLNSTGSSKPESKKDGRQSYSKDTTKESLKKGKGDMGFTAERDLVRHLFTLKRTARNSEKSVLFGRTIRQKKVQ